MKKILINTIRVYRKIGSACFFWSFLGFYGGCRFSPSCSEYSMAAIEKNGPMKGLIKSFFRVLRCGPWSKGGFDLS